MDMVLLTLNVNSKMYARLKNNSKTIELRTSSKIIDSIQTGYTIKFRETGTEAFLNKTISNVQRFQSLEVALLELDVSAVIPNTSYAEAKQAIKNSFPLHNHDKEIVAFYLQ